MELKQGPRVSLIFRSARFLMFLYTSGNEKKIPITNGKRSIIVYEEEQTFLFPKLNGGTKCSEFFSDPQDGYSSHALSTPLLILLFVILLLYCFSKYNPPSLPCNRVLAISEKSNALFVRFFHRLHRVLFHAKKVYLFSSELFENEIIVF